jgi:four helix bundle protein
MNKFGFKELVVWQKSIDFAVKVIKSIKEADKGQKHIKLSEQLESACFSIGQNIAEGKGRYSKKEFAHFLFIARGSLYEVITILNIYYKLDWIKHENLFQLESDAFEIASMLKGLINSLKT